ncbi:hypothetical protein [Anaplasma phagocytophilum]
MGSNPTPSARRGLDPTCVLVVKFFAVRDVKKIVLDTLYDRRDV